MVFDFRCWPLYKMGEQSSREKVVNDKGVFMKEIIVHEFATIH